MQTTSAGQNSRDRMARQFSPTMTFRWLVVALLAALCLNNTAHGIVQAGVVLNSAATEPRASVDWCETFRSAGSHSLQFECWTQMIHMNSTCRMLGSYPAMFTLIYV